MTANKNITLNSISLILSVCLLACNSGSSNMTQGASSSSAQATISPQQPPPASNKATPFDQSVPYKVFSIDFDQISSLTPNYFTTAGTSVYIVDGVDVNSNDSSFIIAQATLNAANNQLTINNGSAIYYEDCDAICPDNCDIDYLLNCDDAISTTYVNTATPLKGTSTNVGLFVNNFAKPSIKNAILIQPNIIQSLLENDKNLQMILVYVFMNSDGQDQIVYQGFDLSSESTFQPSTAIYTDQSKSLYNNATLP